MTHISSVSFGPEPGGGLSATVEAVSDQLRLASLLPRQALVREVEKLGGIDITDWVIIKWLAQRFGLTCSEVSLRLGQLWLQENA